MGACEVAASNCLGPTRPTSSSGRVFPEQWTPRARARRFHVFRVSGNLVRLRRALVGRLRPALFRVSGNIVRLPLRFLASARPDSSCPSCCLLLLLLLPLLLLLLRNSCWSSGVGIAKEAMQEGPTAS